MGLLSVRQIKDSLRLSLGAVQKVTSKASSLDLDWATIEQLDDQQLARHFYPQSDLRASNQFQIPDWIDVNQELKRKGMTKHLLWEEYTHHHEGPGYRDHKKAVRRDNGQEKPFPVYVLKPTIMQDFCI